MPENDRHLEALYETDEEWQRAEDERWYQTITAPHTIAASHVVDVWEEAFNRHDADMLGRLYAADATLESPDFGDPLRGREAIVKYYRELFRRAPDVHREVVRHRQGGGSATREYVLTGTLEKLSLGEPLVEGQRFSLKACSVIDHFGPHIKREAIYYSIHMAHKSDVIEIMSRRFQNEMKASCDRSS